MGETFEDYLAALASRLTSQGFRSVDFGLDPDEWPENLRADKAFHRRKMTVLGIIDTFCAVKCVAMGLTPAIFEAYSKHVFELALAQRRWVHFLSHQRLPATIRENAFLHDLYYTLFNSNSLIESGVIAHPIVVTDVATDALRSFVGGYLPIHWGASEFPVAVELASGNVFYARRTPLWGMLFYAGFRRQAESLFRPQ